MLSSDGSRTSKPELSRMQSEATEEAERIKRANLEWHERQQPKIETGPNGDFVAGTLK